MPATFYRSTDSGAPVLAGNTAGTLINVLDKILVTGYGSQPAAGWTKPFIGTDVAVFRNGATANAQRYLRVSEPSGLYASVRGYADMTDANTGSTPFPSTAQRTADLYWHKTGSATADPRQWWAIADARSLLLLIRYGTTPVWVGYYFGDGLSYVASDAGFSVIIGGTSTSYQFQSSIGTIVSEFNSVSDTSITGLYIGGQPTGAGSIPGVILAGPGRLGCSWPSATVTATTGKFGYPNIDGSIPLNESIVAHPTNYTSPVMTMRGRLRFVYDVPLAIGALNEGDTFSGTGALNGKRFVVVSKLQGSVSTSSSTTLDNIVAVTPDD